MCGIAGLTGSVSAEQLRRFQEQLNHRGPDDRGEFCREGIGLVHDRLAIIDLATGHQPILNESGTCAIVFNGEIYNYAELRDRLRFRHTFTTESDTEVILHLYEEEGTETPRFLRGDFAFCIWDGRDGSCFLSRDPLGVKPLFYSLTGSGDIVFSSEMRALLQHPDVSAEMDPLGVSEYLTRLYVSAPRTILKDVRKLHPGESIVWKAGRIRTLRHWSIPEPEEGSPSGPALIEKTRHLLDVAVRRRLIADVPVGAFLSGGLDSSLIVALASKYAPGLHTFSIGYGDPDFDELQYARKVSALFRTNHHEFVIKPNACELIGQVLDAMDEPIADSSAIPTYLVARETRAHVKVALSGIGGDEVFFGYPRYLGARLGAAVPGPFRSSLAAISRLWTSQPSGHDLGGRFRRFGGGLRMESSERYAMWTSYVSASARSDLIPDVSDGGATEREALEVLQSGKGALLDRIYRYDITRYVPGDLLQLCDNMTMAHSLEARVPFCDVDLVSEMSRVPASRRFPGWKLKPLLRRIAGELLPAEILNRRKQGFMIPIGRWFRHDLRDFAESQMNSSSLPAMFDRRVVRETWESHASGRENHTHLVWAIILLSHWAMKNRGKGADVR